jgi:hypothetical protein
MSLAHLREFFATLGEKPFRAAQVLKWIHQRGVIDFQAMTDISKPLRWPRNALRLLPGRLFSRLFVLCHWQAGI